MYFSLVEVSIHRLSKEIKKKTKKKSTLPKKKKKKSMKETRSQYLKGADISILRLLS